MKNSRLFKALQEFKGSQGKEENLADEFKLIAEAAFYSGYFLINGGAEDEYRIEITCIEFYYHEDEGDVKDEKKYLKGKNEFGYPLGAICPNPSGVDILFDDESKKFHASFLIRGYKAIENNGKIYENNQKSKTWNTQDLWYDLFGGANMLRNGKFSIEWVDNKIVYSESAISYTMERVNLNDGKPWAYTKNNISC